VRVLKGALIGTGNIALLGHLPSYLDKSRIGARAEIVAASDLSEKNLKKFKMLHPSARAYTSTEELMAKEELDFVDICTPPNTHMPIIEMAANNGLHILCEKPLASTMDEVYKILEIVRKTKIVFFPCHQYYYNPQWKIVRETLKEEGMGAPFYARFEVFRTSASMGNANWEPDWRTDPTQGGGIVADHGTHLLYLATSLLGKPIAVTAKNRKFREDIYPVEDTSSIIIEHEKGISNIFLTWASSHRGFNFSILTPTCDIMVKDSSVMFMRNGKMEKVETSENLAGSSTHTNLYPELMENFLDNIEFKDIKLDFLEEAAISAECVFATYESCLQNRRVEIK